MSNQLSNSDLREAERNRIGAILMIAGGCILAMLYLSIFGLLPAMLNDRLPDDYFQLFGLFGLGIGSLIAGAVFRRFDDILQAVLDGAKETQQDDESDTSH
jgi:uncharacterized protein YjeT (DUF2065 family)